jgi:hypothetical protein
MACAYKASQYQPKKRHTPTGLNKTYKVALEEGIMAERCFIQDWGGVFRLLGFPVDYLGHRGPDYELRENEFEILEWVLSIPHENIDWTHFTTGDGKGNCEYDPWGAAGPGYHKSRTVTEGVLASKRVFRVLEW